MKKERVTFLARAEWTHHILRLALEKAPAGMCCSINEHNPATSDNSTGFTYATEQEADEYTVMWNEYYDLVDCVGVAIGMMRGTSGTVEVRRAESVLRIFLMIRPYYAQVWSGNGYYKAYVRFVKLLVRDYRDMRQAV